MDIGMERQLTITPGSHHAVIVVGGGPSGTIAAIAAARLGKNTLLIEKQPFLGGSLTAMGVGPMMSFHNKAGTQVVKGLPQEVIDRLVAAGASPGHIPDSITYCSTVTPFDSESLKIVLETMATEAGVSILFHTHLAGVESVPGQVDAVIVCNKAGLTRYTADVFIDASGDADFAAACGAPFVQGREVDHATQPMTMNFKVSGVATDRLRQYVHDNPDNFIFIDGKESGLKRLDVAGRLSLAGFLKEWSAAKETGEVTVPRDDVLFFETATPGIFIVNTSRIQGLDATNPHDLSEAEIIGRRQCREIFHFLRKRCVGFEDAVLLSTGPQIGVRESRHIRGKYLLTAEDLVSERQFEDPVALGGYPIDIHSPNDGTTQSIHMRDAVAYQIPMRSLLVEQPRNLVVVGRSISATHEASAAFRVTPIAMAIGQAGGTIAAIASTDGIATAEIPYSAVRRQLVAAGACL